MEFFMSKKGHKVWSCGRVRKFRGENQNALHVQRGVKKEGWDIHPDKHPRHVQKSAVMTAIEEEVSEYLAGRQDMLSSTKEVITEVVIIDVEEIPLDKTYGLKRKKNDWLYAKACECGCVTATLGHLEFHHRRCKSKRRRDQQQMSA